MGDVVAENVGVQMWLPSLSEVEPFDLPDGFALRRYRCVPTPPHPTSREIGRTAPKWEVFSRFLATKHRIGAYDGLLCPHVVPSAR